MSRPDVVLIGPPGSGKSTVGALLATRLDVPFRDVDELVEDAAGKTVADIFVEDGEAAFRAMEADTTLAALHGVGVLSLGGGGPMQPAIAEALRDQTVVFLDVTIADAARRIGFDGSRPLLAVNPRASWTRMMNERRPTYESLASVTVDTGGTDPDDVVDRILQSLGTR